MKFFADFHIHSHFSIATSKNLIPEWLDYWARIKGIKVVGTGDFTHPGWLKELKEKLTPAEPGLYRLKDSFKNDHKLQTPFTADQQVRFILTTEISNIYKKDHKVRKVHNVIMAPDFDTVEKIQQSLDKIGNITSDGRPILGLDSRDLLEVALDANENIFFIPAHIWTPWFSALGAKSGFDSIKDCYGDLSDHIHAVETGLSSDPPMNWICSFLDPYTIISNSDAHSPEKLGREANIFDCDLSYEAITDAMKKDNNQRFLGTVEFFPQEGKYHYDGHRKCGVVWNPLETIKHNAVCPVCGKKVTVGVMNRVAQLADRDYLQERATRHQFHSLIPLKELLSEINSAGPNSQKVWQAYNTLLSKGGSEFNVLLNLTIEDLRSVTNEQIVEAIRRMREREVLIKEGYDGEYGQIKVFADEEQQEISSQKSLFATAVSETQPGPNRLPLLSFNLKEYRKIAAEYITTQTEQENLFIQENKAESSPASENLNPAQRQAVTHFEGPALIEAGPGTGKTRVLTQRIAWLIQEKHIVPQKILAVTFTNKAAESMYDRLAGLMQEEQEGSVVNVTTFHAFGYAIIKDNNEASSRSVDFIIIDEKERVDLLRQIVANPKEAGKYAETITRAKQILHGPGEIKDRELSEIFGQYEQRLKRENLIDLDDLIRLPVLMFEQRQDICNHYREKYRWILVDEFQDVNQAQYRLLRILMPAEDSNLFVIGDRNQAIYGFRGADVRFINRFCGDYPQARVYRLQQSYRCSENILSGSQNIIETPTDSRIFLKGLPGNIKIQICPQNTEKSEAEFVARTIEQMMGGLRFFSMDSSVSSGEATETIQSLSDFAVLCRIARQMPAIEKALQDHAIPYQKVQTEALLGSEPLRSLIDTLRFAGQKHDSFLSKRLSEKHNYAQSDWQKIKAIIDEENQVVVILKKIIDAYFKSAFESELPFLEQLYDIAKNCGDRLDDFLKFFILGREIDLYQAKSEQVSLMTLHAAKGLEFKCVFIVGLEDGLFPYALFEKQRTDLAEERRLLYVGMTRAEKYLYLCHAKNRYLMGRSYQLPRSPFLDKIEKELFDTVRQEYRKKPSKDDGQLSLF